MPDYRKMYLLLFNAVTDAVEALDKACPDTARRLLTEAQQKTEEIYVSADK